MKNVATVITILMLLVLAASAVGVNQLMSMPGRSYAGALPPLTDAENEVSLKVKQHVEELATKIGERNADNMEQLNAAADYLEKGLQQSGYTVKSQEFAVGDKKFRNLIAELKGKSAKTLIIGAHYDTASGSPGADDNATGCAATLELARLFANRQTEHSVRFVLFSNKETSIVADMGSKHYAEECREHADQLLGMISIDAIGYYADNAGSQKYPQPFQLFFPDKGNFVAFVSDTTSRPLLVDLIGLFRDDSTTFPSEGLTAPSFIRGVDWSDQRNFWTAGYSALMVTDTAPYRNPQYKKSGDLPATVNFDNTARVVVSLNRALQRLTGVEKDTATSGAESTPPPAVAPAGSSN